MQQSKSEARLRWPVKFLYGLGEVGPSVAAGTVIPFYFLFFLTDIAGIRPGIAGTVLLVASLWDAINDPWVGSLSDRTRSRWGRRRPYMLVGAIPMAIFYALLWAVPDASFPGGRAIYYLLVYFLFDISYTLVSGPYYALTPELSLDSDERTSIVTYRMAVSIVTGLIAAVALQVVFETSGSMEEAFLQSAIVVGALSALPYLLIGAFFRERRDFQTPKTRGFRLSVQALLRSRPFWIALLLYWLAWLAIRVVEAVFAYFLINWSGIPEADTAYVLAIILASAALFLPVVGYLSRHMEKKWAFAACAAFWACLHLALWWVPRDMPLPVYIIAFLAGLGVSAAHVLPNAMGADVLEVIELETGERQEGIYGGVSSFIQKLGTALAVLAIGWTLEWTGYVPGAQQQSAAALTGIRVLTSWVPLSLLVGSVFLSAAFPLTRRTHRALTEEVNRRRLERVARSAP